MKENWFKKREIIVTLSAISLIGGIFFLDPNISGSLILRNKIRFGILPLIGILLVICSVILASYSMIKK